MSRPGDRLRALAARMFDTQTMERLVDPVVADLQAEYGNAARSGRTWRSRWVLLGGYVACLKVIAVSAWRGATQAHRDWTMDDRRALVRVFGFSVLLVVAITLLLELRSLMFFWRHGLVETPLLATLLPAPLTTSLPMGVMLGILFRLRGRTLSRRLMIAIVALGVICSVVSFVNVAWLLPDANQAIRVLVSTRNGNDPRAVQSVPRGLNELTLNELSRQIQRSKQEETVVSRDVRRLEVLYYARWAQTFAPLVLVLLALSIVHRRSLGRLTLSVAAFAACCGYNVTFGHLIRALATNGEIPAVLVAWVPNVLIALVAMLIAVTSTPSAKLAQ